MSDIKLFRIENGSARELEGRAATLEKSLQTLIERNLETVLGVRFLASEYSTGKTHSGRIDTLGIDENQYPVIVEYKRSVNENVINQGLFYLNWLLDHRAEFRELVRERIGPAATKTVEWSSPRLLCIAADFTRYDEHAVQEIGRNIELIRYRKFADDLLLLDLISVAPTTVVPSPGNGGGAVKLGNTVTSLIGKLEPELADLLESLMTHLRTLGDDVQEKTLKNYVAFRRLKNFACVEAHPVKQCLSVYLKVDPDTVQIEEGFSRDVREIGHYGTGDLELTLRDGADFERAKPLIDLSYSAS